MAEASMNELTEELLTAHVQHELSRWSRAALAATLAADVGALFRWLGGVALDEIAGPEQIMGVIRRHVVERPATGGIAELAGDFSRVVFSSQTSVSTRVDQILPESSYEEFAAKVVALDALRRKLITLVTASSAFADIGARVIARTVADLLLPAHAVRVAGSAPGVPQFARRLLPGFSERLRRVLPRYLERRAQRFARESEKHLIEVLNPKRLRSLLDEVWDAVSAMPLAEAFAFIDEHDLEDFVVLGYEFWLKYRKSEYFQKTTAEVVDYFFEKYGKQSLAALIEDMGVSEAMVLRELIEFLGPLLDRAAQTGFLEERLRAELEPFYHSQAVQAVLARRLV